MRLTATDSIAQDHHQWYIFTIENHTPLLPLHEPPHIRQAGLSRHSGQHIERYRLPALWCLHLFSYVAKVQVNGTYFDLRPGVLTIVPPDTTLVYHLEAGLNEHLYVHFACDVQDAPFALPIPVAQNLGRRAGNVRRKLEQIIEQQAMSAMQSVRARQAEANFWSLLWDLATPSDHAEVDDGLPPQVSEAAAFIDTTLHRPLRVQEIAKHVGLSHNHLTRLFKAHLGDTAVGFLRGRRMQRAEHLLSETDRSISRIACEVGLPDLQQFNKTFRRHTGHSPTAWRHAQRYL